MNNLFKGKANPAQLQLLQTIILGIVVLMSLATLGTAAHTLNVFNKQQSSNPWWLPLWPQHFNVHGAKALVASATVTLVLTAAYLVVSFFGFFNMVNRPTTKALLALSTAGLSGVLALATVIYAHVLNKNRRTDTIQTWTCSYRNGRPLQRDLVVPTNLGNGNFKALCHESKFALYGTLVVMLLLCASAGLSVICWRAGQWTERQEAKKGDVDSSIKEGKM